MLYIYVYSYIDICIWNVGRKPFGSAAKAPPGLIPRRPFEAKLTSEGQGFWIWFNDIGGLMVFNEI